VHTIRFRLPLTMRPEDLATDLEFILNRSPALPDRIAGAILIANPKAGGFTRPRYSRRRRAELDTLIERAVVLPPRPDPVPLCLTAEPGHASALARDFFDSSRGAPSAGRKDKKGGRLRLVITAGGDGTSLEVLSALMELPPAERNGYAVLRLPFGTGNDGSEGRDLHSALGRLLGPCSPTPRPALLFTPNPAGGKPRLWSFNIASIGADAFVNHMTNKLKTAFPGDSYKLMVDLVTLFYDFIYPPRPLSVKAWGGAGAESREFERDCLLLAVGVTGNRQYGSNKAILPGEENVCFVAQMSTLRKLFVKGPIQKGRHRGLPEVDFFSAERLELSYPEAITFQADGEVARLEAADFPLRVELLPASYNAIAPSAK
jgi:diacylglycerol kinase family enzyme